MTLRHSPLTTELSGTSLTAHFVAPAQFVIGDKTCTPNGTFCHPLHTLSPEGDKMCSRSRHILSPSTERERDYHVIKSEKKSL